MFWELVAIFVFLFTYALIVDERIHRAVAAMIGAAIVIFLHIVPWDSLLVYLDFGTIFLLMGMMIIVNTARTSGLFEYIAIRTAKLAKGSPIKVLILFSLVTALASAFLDNVTTVLLLTPMLLTIARLMKLNPLPYLIAEIFASNVGGAATLIGDPPNIMIASAAGLTFNEFLMVMAPIALIDLGIIILMMFLIYGKSMKVEPHERDVLMRAMENLDENAAIQDRSLFKKSIVTILLVVVMFFFHSLLGLEPAEVALIGAAIILFWSREPPEMILEKTEWPALFFFGGLFIVVGALVETGVISQIATAMVGLVSTTGEAMILVVWFSAVASALVDNIPLTAAMIPLIKDLGTSMNIYPLWWALAVGACLGGNGTAIGASANVVVLGISEREGIRISFLDFMKLGMVVMAITVAVGLGLLWVMFIL